MNKGVRLFLFLWLVVARSFAWGPEGHHIVGDIARERLNPIARQKVQLLLGNDDLAAVAVWADEIRGQRPETSGWHFVDIPADASGFSEPRDCYRPDDKHPSSLEDHHNCVVDRITIFSQVLTDANAPAPARIEALKFLVHFVGDIHQPLHAIGQARGGNDIHVIEFGSPQCGKYVCNLHFAWDTGLIAHTGLAEAQYVSRLDRLITSENLDRGSLEAPPEWANESFRLAKKVWLNDGGSVDEPYYRNDIAIVDQRLASAGLRLALILNQALGK
jgi:S1/P1 Nuclease